MEEKRECPICLRPNCSSKQYEDPNDLKTTTKISCDVCGEYPFLSAAEPSNLDHKQRVILSSFFHNKYEREEKSPRISEGNKKDILNSISVPSDPLEAIDLLLEYIFYKAGRAGKQTPIDFKTDYPILFAENHDEFEFCVYKARELNLIEIAELDGKKLLRLSIDGWRRIAELKKTKVKANQAFVAMWFDPSLNQAWIEGFQQALERDLPEDKRYKAIRIDLVEHNEKICDKIMAEIRKSGLVVADLTGQRGGVYFEAGFAKGLGIPVIWTCRDTDIEKLHFDIRQYNHIKWNNPDDLRERLINRIEATMPRK
jgi:hypothetical protein